jgi:hypothetical protein
LNQKLPDTQILHTEPICVECKHYEYTPEMGHNCARPLAPIWNNVLGWTPRKVDMSCWVERNQGDNYRRTCGISGDFFEPK